MELQRDYSFHIRTTYFHCLEHTLLAVTFQHLQDISYKGILEFSETLEI